MQDNNNFNNENENSREANDNYENNAYRNSTYHYTSDNIHQDQTHTSNNASNGNYYGSEQNGYKDTNNRNDNYSWNFSDYEAAGKTQKTKKNNGIVILFSILACIALIGVVTLSGYGVYSIFKDNANGVIIGTESNSEAPTAEDSIEINDKPVDMSGVPVYTANGLDSRDIAKKVTPSVVGITQYEDYNSFNPSGYGSGIIISEDGYIVTNAHVVNNAIAINVETNDGETYSAKIIGIDTRSDLAVIKIEAQNLPVAEFGNSDELEVGEKVVAIGNPGSSALAGTFTQGVVSGINRLIKEGGYSVKYIQVDAAINPGNSGGALVNSFGQVVGINAAKIAAVDYEGIGFSIPIKEVKPIIDDLMRNGYVSGRTKIGLNGKEIPQVLADINGVPTGIMIYNIETTADLATTKATKGDIITHIDGVRVETFDEVAECLDGKKAGETIRISIFRPLNRTGGKSFDITCKLMPDVDRQVNVAQ